MSDTDWNLIHNVHLNGSYKVTKAAWTIFQQQKFGRIIMTSSAAGIYGNYGQANYSAAKMGLHGFCLSLSKEGASKNIHCNTIAPLAASRLTESVMPPEILKALKPEYVAPFVAYLCHENCVENGSLFEVGAGFISKLRIERSNGLLMNVKDKSFTPSGVAQVFEKAKDFSRCSHPSTIAEVDWMDLIERSKKVPNVKEAQGKSFKDKIALVTGAGGGLGQQYAIMLAKNGAVVVVNDFSKEHADKVVAEIVALGFKAVPNYESVINGKNIIESVVSQFGRIDILINNAGVLRDKSFSKMTDKEWNFVIDVHLNGSYHVTKAAWPYMMKSKYGRIINTASAVGLYGNFGQANYSSAKAALIGFTKVLALEGSRFNINANCVAPNAGTQMTATVLPSDMIEVLKPDYVAPFVGYLCLEDCQESGNVFEIGSGWCAQVKWQRSAGHKFALTNLNLETINDKWSKVISFEVGSTYPSTPQESFTLMYSPQSHVSETASGSFEYTDRDVILYNLGIGAHKDELPFVYENDSKFCAIPSFGVIPSFSTMMAANFDEYLENFSPVKNF